MIACIACGGIIETTLVVMGLGVLFRWLKKRHDKKSCKCCKDHQHND